MLKPSGFETNFIDFNDRAEEEKSCEIFKNDIQINLRNKPNADKILVSDESQPKNRDSSPDLNSIGVDGSQRFSDVLMGDGTKGGQNTTQESMIVFNPVKTQETNNENLFSQEMSSQENLKFKEMLGHMQSIKDENQKLKLENEELKGKLGGMTRSTV